MRHPPRIGFWLACLAAFAAGAPAQEPGAAPDKAAAPVLPAPKPANGEAGATTELPPELAALQALPATGIDLATALRLAGIQNPQLLFARERVVEAVALRQLAAAQILPSMNAGTNFDAHTGPVQQSSGNILKLNRSSLFVGAGADAVAAGTLNIPGVGYNLNIGQSVFNYLVSRQLVTQREFHSLAVRNEVLARVVLAYTNLLEAAGGRSLALQTRNEAQKVAQMMADYVKTGLAKASDAERTATFLRDRDTDLVEAEARLLTMSAQLAEVLNLDPAVRLQPVEDRVVPQPVVPDPIPLPELLAIAALQRPDLSAQRAAIRQALLRVRGARLLAFSPQLFLGYGAGTYGGGSNLVASTNPVRFGAPLSEPRFGDFAPRSDFDVYTYWTLRNMGLGNLANIRLERSRLGAADLEQLVILNRVRAEVAEAYVRTHVRFAQVVANERSVRAGVDAFVEDFRRIKGGVGLPLELLESLRLLGQARLEYLHAIVGYNQAQLLLYVALGQPPADMLARPVPQGPIPPLAEEKQLLEGSAKPNR